MWKESWYVVRDTVCQEMVESEDARVYFYTFEITVTTEAGCHHHDIPVGEATLLLLVVIMSYESNVPLMIRSKVHEACSERGCAYCLQRSDRVFALRPNEPLGLLQHGSAGHCESFFVSST